MDIDTSDSIVMALLILGAVIFAFIILRELVLWYWKVNDIIKNQEEQNRLLRKIAGEEEPKKE